MTSIVADWYAGVLRRNPRAPERPKPGGASSWYSIFAERGAPRVGERGHALDPLRPVLSEVDRIAARAVQLWRDPEVGPWIGQLLDGDVEDGPHGFTASDIPELLGLNVTTDDALSLMEIVQESLVETDRAVPPGLVRGIARDALADEAMRQQAREYESKPRLVNVPKDEAVAFIRRHHSALSEPNTRGLLYAIGVQLGGRLVAVATATTPSGRYAHPDSVLELSRIASDGSTKGASSMLAARILDLLPDSGRFGAPGRLFVTYSLMHEPGTTYLALVDKGLRPVGVIAGKHQGGARKGPSTGLPQEAKVVWEAGPSAGPAKWSVLADPVSADRLAGAAKAFAKWEERQKRRNPAQVFVVAPHVYPPESKYGTAPADFVRGVAHDLKAGDATAIRYAAAAMSPYVPRHATLVPVPNSRGGTDENRQLALAIGRATGAKVMDGLARDRSESQYARRKRGLSPLPASAQRVQWVGARPHGAVVLIDNIITTGATAEAARRAIGGDIAILVWADARRTRR